MKNSHQIFISLFCSIIIIYLLSACNKNDNSVYNWKTIYQNNDLDLYSLNFLDKDNGFVMADSSGIHDASGWKLVLSTTDGGITWKQVTCSIYDNLNEFPLYDIGYVYPISKNVLLATGYRVHKSDDSGKTWINVSPQLVDAYINNLYVIDSLTWLVAKGTFIFRTDNGGQTWETVFQTDFPGAFERFSFPSLNIGYITIGFVNYDHNADVGLILKTTDKGKTWTIMTPEPWKSKGIPIPYMVSMQFTSEMIGYISTFGDSKLYKTTDGGDNWTLISDKDVANGLEYFITEDLGYCSDGLTIYVTNNGGKSWKIDHNNNAADSDILTWTFLKTGEGYALTRDNRIIRNY
jgi:photosystem II stability/assembly factor-like uncharacterized protein